MWKINVSWILFCALGFLILIEYHLHYSRYFVIWLLIVICYNLLALIAISICADRPEIHKNNNQNVNFHLNKICISDYLNYNNELHISSSDLDEQLKVQTRYYDIIDYLYELDRKCNFVVYILYGFLLLLDAFFISLKIYTSKSDIICYTVCITAIAYIPLLVLFFLIRRLTLNFLYKHKGIFLFGRINDFFTKKESFKTYDEHVDYTKNYIYDGVNADDIKEYQNSPEKYENEIKSLKNHIENTNDIEAYKAMQEHMQRLLSKHPRKQLSWNKTQQTYDYIRRHYDYLCKVKKSIRETYTFGIVIIVLFLITFSIMITQFLV